MVVSIDVCVVFDKDSLVWKKKLLKLVKVVFKFFIVIKGDDNGKVWVKMFKLLKFNFVSFVIVKFDNNYDVFKNVYEEKMFKIVVCLDVFE